MTQVELEGLVKRFERARRRVASASPFSPDWDAASAELAEVTALLAAAGDRPVARPWEVEAALRPSA